jgi:peptide-methionine (R)-S-oxide reductase
MISRRTAILGATGLAGVAGLAGLGHFGGRGSRGGAAIAAEAEFEVVRSDEEWRAILTPEQHHILRQEGTERAWTSPLLEEAREGVFHCAGCENPLYESRTKYDSRTGWPSFWDAIPGAVGTREDRSFFMVRTEVHCARCGGHLGHIFEDGPPPTGLRHCINGLALVFRPADAA